ncbi:hypothetical protein ACJJVG_08815 [Pseudocitrobacter faecalis]|uniref:hypothetical protein n=1 Tax=Pseudocitrobacter faecalis TaxID=1398493 RepID=UPI00389AF1B2
MRLLAQNDSLEWITGLMINHTISIESDNVTGYLTFDGVKYPREYSPDIGFYYFFDCHYVKESDAAFLEDLTPAAVITDPQKYANMQVWIEDGCIATK